MATKEPGYVYILTNPSFFMLVGHEGENSYNRDFDY